MLTSFALLNIQYLSGVPLNYYLRLQRMTFLFTRIVLFLFF
jgi:hypothetical protein